MDPILVLSGKVMGKAYNPHVDGPVVVTLNIAGISTPVALPFSGHEAARGFNDTVQRVDDEKGGYKNSYVSGQEVTLVVFDKKDWDAAVKQDPSLLGSGLSDEEKKKRDEQAVALRNTGAAPSNPAPPAPVKPAQESAGDDAKTRQIREQMLADQATRNAADAARARGETPPPTNAPANNPQPGASQTSSPQAPQLAPLQPGNLSPQPGEPLAANEVKVANPTQPTSVPPDTNPNTPAPVAASPANLVTEPQK